MATISNIILLLYNITKILFTNDKSHNQIFGYGFYNSQHCLKLAQYKEICNI